MYALTTEKYPAPGHIEMSQYVLPFEHTDIHEAEILARLLWIWKQKKAWEQIPYSKLFNQIATEIRTYLDILPIQRKKFGGYAVYMYHEEQPETSSRSHLSLRNSVIMDISLWIVILRNSRMY